MLVVDIGGGTSDFTVGASPVRNRPGMPTAQDILATTGGTYRRRSFDHRLQRGPGHAAAGLQASAPVGAKVPAACSSISPPGI